MERNSSIKKAAAMCVSVMLSLCIFAGSSVVSPIKTHADNKKSATTNVYDKKLSQLENEQKRLESEIAAAQQQIDSAADNIESLKIKSAALKKQIESYKAQSLQIELEIANVDSKLREAKKKLEQQTTDIEKSTEDFMKRIRTMYIAGSANSYENILLDSQDFYDVLMRTELVKRVANHDSKQLEKLLADKRELEQTKAQVKESLEKLKETSEGYVKKQQELADKQKELASLQAEEEKKSADLNEQKNSLDEKSAEVSRQYGIISKKAQQTTSVPSTTTAKPKVTESEVSKSEASSTTPSQTNNTTTKAPERTNPPVQTTNPPATTKKTEASAPGGDTGSSTSSKIDTVLAYAKSNVGGAYVWGGSDFRATDCSGLVMLSYAQVGISLPHLASAQAAYGTEVSYYNMQPGDLIFFGGGSYSSIYHVAIYIGNGLMVHAENTDVGIVISDVAGFSSSNNITVIKRLL